MKRSDEIYYEMIRKIQNGKRPRFDIRLSDYMKKTVLSKAERELKENRNVEANQKLLELYYG